VSTYVSIGRNVDGVRMRSQRWESFRLATLEAVEQHAGPVVASAEGIGRYNGEVEGTFVVVGAAYGGYALERALGKLAAEYGQESIAVTYGSPSFIGPR
jgi:hypothetical protein